MFILPLKSGYWRITTYSFSYQLGIFVEHNVLIYQKPGDITSEAGHVKGAD